MTLSNGDTLEDAGRYLEHPRLPFSSYGALALAHSDDPMMVHPSFSFICSSQK